MPNLLPDIPNHIAANMLKHEHTKLTTKRQQLITEITQRQHQIDKIDAGQTWVTDPARFGKFGKGWVTRFFA